MKKIFMAIVAMTMLIATSCKKENVNAPENLVPGEGEFLVTIANAPRQNAPAAPSDGMTVKTIIDDTDILWQEGDMISINGVIYETDMTGPSVIFKSKGGAAAPDGDGNYKAYYPVDIAGGMFLNEFAYDGENLKNLPMYAESDNNVLTFHNICAALKITVPVDCDQIVISANENLAGKFSIGTDVETGAPMAVLSTDEYLADLMSKEITVNGTFATDGIVYVAIPAGTYNNLTVTMYNNGHVYHKRSLSSAVTVKVNNLYNLNVSKVPMDDVFHFTALGDNAQITAPTGRNLEYCVYHSSNNTCDSWTNCTTAVQLPEAGDKIYFRVIAGSSNSVIGSKFIISGDGNVSVGGNVMYLLDHNGTTVSMGEECFKNLFISQAKLIDAKDLILPAETLATKCYYYMFSNCSNLTTAPALPAKTLATSCYYYMFSNCSTLTTAPVLPATTLAQDCYNNMFNGCINLQNVPDLSSVELAENCCNRMFFGCSSLTTAPALPAETLATKCYYQMFSGCSSLTTAPVLNATTLAEKCYYGMFNNCSKLPSVTILATDVNATNCLFNWLQNAGTDESVTTRTVHCKSSVQSAIQNKTPNTWTVLGDQ